LLLEKSFRISRSDLQARPIYHHQRDSIEAHLTIVFTALAISRWIENQTGWPIRSLSAPPAATAPSRSRPAPTPSPPPTHSDDLRQALDRIHERSGAHERVRSQV
jgi:hypothetical protein